MMTIYRSESEARCALQQLQSERRNNSTENWNELYEKTITTNLVIRGVPEVERNDDQLNALVGVIFSSVDKEEAQQMATCTLLGKNNTNTTNRPIVVYFKNEGPKIAIMMAEHSTHLSCNMEQSLE